jgi:hypothetical protein
MILSSFLVPLKLQGIADAAALIMRADISQNNLEMRFGQLAEVLRFLSLM